MSLNSTVGPSPARRTRTRSRRRSEQPVSKLSNFSLTSPPQAFVCCCCCCFLEQHGLDWSPSPRSTGESARRRGARRSNHVSMTPLSPSGSWSVDGVGGVLASAASSLGRTSRRRGPPTRRRLPEVLPCAGARASSGRAPGPATRRAPQSRFRAASSPRTPTPL